MNILAINIAGLITIAVIILWFWFSKPRAKAVAGSQPIEIIVDEGVYTPARIEVSAGKPVTLRFIRKDPNPCAERVLFDSLGVSADLAMDKPVNVTITPDQPGEYEFTCQMRMYRGNLVVRRE